MTVGIEDIDGCPESRRAIKLDRTEGDRDVVCFAVVDHLLDISAHVKTQMTDASFILVGKLLPGWEDNNVDEDRKKKQPFSLSRTVRPKRRAVNRTGARSKR